MIKDGSKIENYLIDAKNYLDCIVCLELALSALMCQKCGNIVCKECCSKFQTRNLREETKECPCCKEIVKFIPNLLARKMIGSIPKTCPDCMFITTIGNFKDHKIKCPNRKITCTESGCLFQGKQDEFFTHLIERHK